MNPTAIVGLFMITVVSVTASISSGISPAALWNFSGFVIVGGGAFAATLISFEFRDRRRAFASLWIVFHHQKDQSRRAAEDLGESQADGHTK